MPPKAKVPKLEKIVAFCTTNTDFTTKNCDPESNAQDEVSKPSSSEE